MNFKKSFVSVALLILVFSISIVFGQKGAKTAFKIAKAGVGIDGVRVGRSTRADVIRKYGRNFKTLKHGGYSAQMKYSRGMSFYYCQKDRKQEIFNIELRSPAKVKTGKGIVLSKSTLSDIYKLYGRAKEGLQYRGIEFYYAKFNRKKVVSVIDIVENKGMRQCD